MRFVARLFDSSLESVKENRKRRLKRFAPSPSQVGSSLNEKLQSLDSSISETINIFTPGDDESHLASEEV